MSDPVPTAAGSALMELLEVSPQVDAAVILEREGGRLLASAPAGSDRMADRLGTTAHRILEAAEQARTELGREPISQVEVGTPDGHVFVVADASWLVAAVTDADPTVGLVFYDLKTALRSVREARDTSDTSGSNGNGSSSPAIVTSAATTSSGDEQTSAGDDPSPTDDDSSSNDDAGTTADGDAQPGSARWRRRKS